MREIEDKFVSSGRVHPSQEKQDEGQMFNDEDPNCYAGFSDDEDDDPTGFSGGFSLKQAKEINT